MSEGASSAQGDVRGDFLYRTRSRSLVRPGLLSWCVVALAVDPLAGLQQLPPAAPAELGVELSLSSHQWKDEVLNPSRHSGWFPTLDVRRDGAGETSRSRWQLKVALSPVGTRFDHGTNSFVAGLELAYDHLRPAAQLGERLDLWVGGRLAASTDMAFFGKWDDSHVYWLTSYSVGVTGFVDRRFGARRVLALEWSVPVLGLVSRPESPILYKAQNPSFGAILGRMNDNLRVTSLHEHRAIDLTLRFTPSGAGLVRSFFLRAEYANTDLAGSAPIEILRQSLGVELVP